MKEPTMRQTTPKQQRRGQRHTVIDDPAVRRRALITEIRTAVREGIASGRGRLANDVFDRLERKHQRKSRAR
jgi:hypothetical protein